MSSFNFSGLPIGNKKKTRAAPGAPPESRPVTPDSTSPTGPKPTTPSFVPPAGNVVAISPTGTLDPTAHRKMQPRGETPPEVTAPLSVMPADTTFVAQNDPQADQAKALWAQMLADYDASLGGKMEQTYRDESLAGRRMAEMNAGLGRGVSGGFTSGVEQTALGGMAQRQDVLNKHTQQGLEMKMAYLDKLIRQAEASNDRELTRELEKERNETALLIAGAGIDTTDQAGVESVEDLKADLGTVEGGVDTGSNAGGGSGDTALRDMGIGAVTGGLPGAFGDAAARGVSEDYDEDWGVAKNVFRPSKWRL